jgi:hypothetical protein
MLCWHYHAHVVRSYWLRPLPIVVDDVILDDVAMSYGTRWQTLSFRVLGVTRGDFFLVIHITDSSSIDDIHGSPQ